MSIEAEALLAAIIRNEDNAKEYLRILLPGELKRFRKTLSVLDDWIADIQNEPTDETNTNEEI